MHPLTADIPFGPFENTSLEAFVGGRSKTARIHADPSCNPSAVPTTMPLNAQTVDRMCRQCGRWGRWTRSDTAAGIFLDAVRWMPRDIPDPEQLEEDFPPARQDQAARLLATGEYPDDDDDDTAWDEYKQAREHRDGVVDTWMYAIDTMRTLCRTIDSYPWLSPWAEPARSGREAEAERLRRWVAELIDERSLIGAAVARSLPEPDHPSDRQELEIIGRPDQVAQAFKQAWRCWQRDVTDTWGGVTTSGGYRAREPLTSPIDRKRKGREAAMAVLDEVFADWEGHALVAADATSRERVRTLAVSMADAWPTDADRRKPQLSPWENGVLAHYAVAFEWARAAALLVVPESVATCLLGLRGDLNPTELPSDGDSVATFRQWARDTLPVVAGGPLPGVLDDAPIAFRRPLAPGNLDALVEVGGWLYQVWSVAHGMEVLHVDVLRARQEAGWQGIVVAGPHDLPASLIDPWVDEVIADADREDEFDQFGIRQGEITVVSLARGGDRRQIESDLRVLALARGASDLRTLGGERRRGRRDNHVWFGLLSFRQLDLTPFEPPSDDRFWRGGLSLPLSVLATAQIYSTSIGTLGYKGHSPSCAHAKSGGMILDDHYEMVTVKDLVNRQDLEWCSKCGGYAVRRLDDAQVRYYADSHRLLDVSRELDHQEHNSLPAAQRDKIVADLAELADAHPGRRTWDEDARIWLDLVDRLRARVRSLSVNI